MGRKESAAQGELVTAELVAHAAPPQAGGEPHDRADRNEPGDRKGGIAQGLTAVLASDEGKDIAQGFQVDVEGEGRDEGQDH